MDYDDEGNEYGSDEETDVDQVLESIEQERNQAAAEEDAVEAVLSNAIDRIEEANVWKLLIAQEVIEQGSATDRVVHSVNSQLKRFALDRLEILLGMDKPKKIDKPLFDQDQIRALKILAAKVLGRSVASVIAEESQPKLATQSMETHAAPKLKTVAAAAGPQLRQQSRPVQRTAPAQQQVQQQRPQQPKRRNNGRTALPGSKADKGFAVPSGNIQPKTMPTPDQMVASAVGVSVPMNIKTDAGINPQQAAKGGASLLQSVVSQLTGGNMIHVDSTAPADSVDAGTNERF
jgi:hypothetical protein